MLGMQTGRTLANIFLCAALSAAAFGLLVAGAIWLRSGHGQDGLEENDSVGHVAFWA